MDEWDTAHCQDGGRASREDTESQNNLGWKRPPGHPVQHQSGLLSAITKPRPLVPCPRVFLIPPGMGTPLLHWTPVPVLEAMMDQQEDEDQCMSSFPCTQLPHSDH